MLRWNIARRLSEMLLFAALLAVGPTAWAQQKTIKIGVVYDLTGPFAGGGSVLHYDGAKIMIDWFNAHGGIDGYKVDPVYVDSQSKPDVAINEAVRLIEQEKVDMLLGFFSSAECVPAAARIEEFKKFMWITTCIASPVLRDRHLKYVFRPQPYGTQWGLASTAMLAAYAKPQLGKDPKDLRVAIIHEDGPYGTDVAKGNEMGAKQAGMNVVVNEGYSVTAPDLSSLITKLKRARPDVILHTGYNPDISLFLRQARELGLHFDALVGHGAGYTDYNKIKSSVGNDANYFFDVDPISIWETNPKSLKADLPPMIQMVGDAYMKLLPDTVIKSPHLGMAASNTYLFLYDVLPRAITKYGGITADDLRQAALDTDVPDGGTMLGFGVKFEGPDDGMSGQNDRAFPVVIQYIDNKSYVVWPKSQQQREPVLKLPPSSPYAAQ
ncbi:MAG TPA: ABC transporter substrate-binding protein [Acetobacteraceae bacterium]|jgi:ABC-type branched-subunit amino acid transport system substrate-binding protein|nr:ABC transporter substrate-binding protein [Acetobacteraceae bacterium]